MVNKLNIACCLASFLCFFFAADLQAQKRKTLKADPEILKITDSALSRSAGQYLQLMETVPDTLFPRTFQNNRLLTATSPSWISGFYPGTLLLLYEFNNSNKFKEEALKKLKVLKKEQFNTGTHDLGFMMYCSFGTAKRLFKTKAYDPVLLNSAASLSQRFHDEVGLIRSWDHKPEKWKYPVIIDNMMNLELLTWASRLSGNQRFYNIAKQHADLTIKNHFRPDYSSYHVIDYDPKTGKVLNKLTEQGYSDESAWARGQAWALYGYTMMYRETGDAKYLEMAMHIADYILKHPNLPADKIPYWDFNAPDQSAAPRDASAAAVMSSALIELSGFSKGDKGKVYLKTAEAMLRQLSSPEYLAQPGTNGGFILKHSVGFLPAGSEVDVPLSYADYYYVEAMLRYRTLKK
ncbi:glycoside hydrolase family 88 protein [Pedobacter heparinus]|uniref:Glycosyl hydrolase family 88 n=1 Tax=Pedobacter heparinus (strain ATCC 13125 / DSM 2366 / CIP 104194 / JCM 7457 / NBRC 12017 / NCIMB 9290 / NRRL B-14731 / HIM 762-3) TaxID=485917 RepID=C6Y2W9_PEDHD|nr:glycoside hydrolase family 88 protein [Pedobacter heparinus]ACU03182.1 glycosyl hydrolase family 88 [Pedobacter heparinus DSM 2366]